MSGDEFESTRKMLHNTAKLRGHELESATFHPDADGKHRTATIRADGGEFTGSPGECIRWLGQLPDRYDSSNFRTDLNRMARGEQL